jgi:hypothetical protein
MFEENNHTDRSFRLNQVCQFVSPVSLTDLDAVMLESDETDFSFSGNEPPSMFLIERVPPIILYKGTKYLSITNPNHDIKKMKEIHFESNCW